MGYNEIGQQFLNWAGAKQQEAEANAKAHTFNLGNVLPALITGALTGGMGLAGLPAILQGAAGGALSAGGMAAAGEGVRAATGSDQNLAALPAAIIAKYGKTAPTPTTGSMTSSAGAIGPRLPNNNFISDAAKAIKPEQPNPFMQGMQSQLYYQPDRSEAATLAKSAADLAHTQAETGELGARAKYYNSQSGKADKWQPTTKTYYTDDDIPDDLKGEFAAIGGKIVKRGKAAPIITLKQ